MGIKIIRVIDRIINVVITGFCAILILFGIYGLWDSAQIEKQADVGNFKPYKPEAEDVSFEELQKINPDIFGWLSVEGTNIDYPLVHGKDNSKYVNTDIYGEFSLSGSLFLDARNQEDFSDFNNIIYGHHMEKKAMFGELVNFSQKDYFDEHPKGRLYWDGRWHDIEFFAFLAIDAYDQVIYDTGIQSKAQREAYLSYAQANALQWRSLIADDVSNYLVLSTCTSESTNGRHVLLGRIKEK